MPKTITKRCIGCRVPIKLSRQQLKTDRMEMRQRDGIKRSGRAICEHCFNCGPAHKA